MFRVILIAVLWCQVSPLIIRSGLGKIDNRNAQQAGNAFTANTQLKLANFEADDGFNHGQESFFTKANDEGSFAQQAQVENQKSDSGNYNKEEFGNVDQGSVSDHGNKEAHKKGHHKSGFHNTYHKDESGSNSSYFDDAKDEGAEYNRDTKKGAYGHNLQNRQEGFNTNSNLNSNANNQRGVYQQGGLHEKNDGGRRDFNKKYYNDDYRRGAYDRGYDQYNRELHNDQQYYNNPRAYSHPDQRITIYEDPYYQRYNTRDSYRDIDRYYDYPNHVNMRTKYNDRHHYEQRPTYSDDYY